MRTPLILSGILHLALIILALIGLPHLIKEREVVQLQEVPVDVVEVGPMTIAKLAQPNPKPAPPPPRPAPPKPQPPEPPKQAKEEPPPPPEVKLPEPPKQVAEKPPEPKPEPPKPQPKPEPKPEPPKKEEPKLEPPKKEEPKPKPPEPKKEEPKPEPKKEEPKKSFDSVLKNVAKLKPDTPPAKEAPKDATHTPSPSPSPAPSPLAAQTGDHLSISEEDALRRQIRNCWNVPVGAKGVESMQAEIRVLFDANLRVTNVQYVSGTGNPNTDPHFRAFVESALRAPLLPGCNTLNIPREKYADKGSILMKFSPKDMF